MCECLHLLPSIRTLNKFSSCLTDKPAEWSFHNILYSINYIKHKHGSWIRLPTKKVHTRWARLETIIQRHIPILKLGWETHNSPFNPAGGRNSKRTSLLRNRKQISNPITGGESEIPPHENTRNRVKWIKFNFLMKCDWFYFGRDETLSESLKASKERLRKRTIQHTFNSGRQWPVLRRNTHTHTHWWYLICFCRETWWKKAIERLESLELCTPARLFLEHFRLLHENNFSSPFSHSL